MDQPRLGLALQPGLGKTRTVLEAIRLSVDVRPWLVVAPKRVVATVWRQENEKWGALPPGAIVALGSEDFRLGLVPRKPSRTDPSPKGLERGFKDLAATRAHLRAVIEAHRVVVVSWDYVFWLAAAVVTARPVFGGLVLDESHYVKDQGTQRFKAVRRLAAGCVMRTALNGTPIANGWEDTWSQSFLLDLGETFGRTLTDFRRRFLSAYVDEHNRVKYGEPSQAQRGELEALFPKLWLPMTAKGWVALPDLIVNDIVVELDSAPMGTASRLMRAALADLPDGTQVLPPNVAAGIGKALQVCQGRAYVDDKVVVVHNAKRDALAELSQEIEGGALVFYEYRHDMDAIRQALGDRVGFIEDPGAQGAWQAGRVQFLAAHPASMAVGLNLQSRGNTVIWYGLTWDSFLYQQANARVHRLGNEHPSVIVHRIVSAHPVERMQARALLGKMNLLSAVMALKGEL